MSTTPTTPAASTAPAQTTAAKVTNDITAVQTIGNTILATVETADPAVALPAQTAETVLDLLAQLAAAALTAWSNASSEPITVANVQALMPNATPLTPPPTS